MHFSDYLAGSTVVCPSPVRGSFPFSASSSNAFYSIAPAVNSSRKESEENNEINSLSVAISSFSLTSCEPVSAAPVPIVSFSQVLQQSQVSGAQEASPQEIAKQETNPHPAKTESTEEVQKPSEKMTPKQFEEYVIKTSNSWGTLSFKEKSEAIDTIEKMGEESIQNGCDWGRLDAAFSNIIKEHHKDIEKIEDFDPRMAAFQETVHHIFTDLPVAERTIFLVYHQPKIIEALQEKINGIFVEGPVYATGLKISENDFQALTTVDDDERSLRVDVSSLSEKALTLLITFLETEQVEITEENCEWELFDFARQYNLEKVLEAFYSYFHVQFTTQINEDERVL